MSGHGFPKKLPVQALIATVIALQVLVPLAVPVTLRAQRAPLKLDIPGGGGIDPTQYTNFQAAQQAGATGAGVAGSLLTVPTRSNPIFSGPPLLDWNNFKEYILDRVATIITTTVVRSLTRQVLAWIQGGNVGFVSILEQEFGRAVDIAGGDVLNKLAGINLCGNINAYLRLTLRLPGLRQRLACTVTDIARNLTNFYRDFTRGGWKSFIQVTVEPQNNPYGAFLIALDAKIDAERAAQEGLLTKYLAGRGFTGVQKPVKIGCEAYATNRTGGREVVCNNGQKVTLPGDQVAQQLGFVLTNDYRKALLADEINEALVTIANALITKVISSTFSIRSGDTTVSGEGLESPELTKTPTEDISQGTIALRVNEALFTAASYLVAIDQQENSTRQQLFNLRARIEQITLDPGANQQEADELRKQTGGQELALAQALEQKRTVLLSQRELLGIKRRAASPVSTDDFSAIANDYVGAISRLVGAGSALNNAPATLPSSGNEKIDLISLINTGEGELKRTADDLNNTINEADRLMKSTLVSTSQKQNLIAARANLVKEQSNLQNSVTALGVLRTKVLAAEDTGLKDLEIEAVTKLLSNNLAISSAVTTLSGTDPLLKLPSAQ